MTDKSRTSSFILPMTAGIAAYLSITIFLLSTFPSFRNHIVYPLDDTYIYMAMARNIADLGIWGVTPHGFSGTSSAHIWIVILAACYKVFGAGEVIPLVLNFVFGISCFIVLGLACNDFRFSKKAIYVSTFSFLVCAFIPQLTTIGMETVLLCLLTLIFLWSAYRLLTLDSVSNMQLLIAGIGTAAFCACRYEALYVVAPIVFLFLLRRQFKEALIVFASASFPILLYGIFSIANGELFFPNTILLKGRVGFRDPIEGIITKPAEVGETALKQLWLIGTLGFYGFIRAGELLAGRSKACIAIATVLMISTLLGVFDSTGLLTVVGFHDQFHILHSLIFLTVLLIAVAAFLHLIKEAKNADFWRLMLDVVVLATVAHLLTARFGWLFRYEAYLLTLLSLVFVPYIANIYRSLKVQKLAFFKNYINLGIVLSIFVFSFGVSVRLLLSCAVTAGYAKGVRYQHLEIANFVRKNYGQSRIMANDIGALCFFAKDIQLLDMFGLASMEVAYARAKNQLTPDFVVEYARHNKADLAIVQNGFWKDIGWPRIWTKAGEWETPPAYNGFKRVSFYAIDNNLEAGLKTALKKYKLPKEDHLVEGDSNRN